MGCLPRRSAPEKKAGYSDVCGRQVFLIPSFLAVGDPTFEKTIEQFDFSLRPELKRQVVLNCMDETFVHQGRSMVLIGPTGTGKTHVSISVGIKMIQLGYTVKFVMAQGLINDYVGMTSMEDRQELLNLLAKVDLLIIDEFGYLPHDKEAGSLFYQVISDRYEKNGTIITSNKSLRSWAEMLHDSSLATALIDRLMHHGEVFYLSGDSYRLRGKRKYLEESIASEEMETADRQAKTG